jgi:hypothetical protein
VPRSLPGEHRDRVYRKQGWISPVLLVASSGSTDDHPPSQLAGFVKRTFCPSLGAEHSLPWNAAGLSSAPQLSRSFSSMPGEPTSRATERASSSRARPPRSPGRARPARRRTPSPGHGEQVVAARLEPLARQPPGERPAQVVRMIITLHGA